MGVTGALMGYGSYLNRSSSTNAPSPYVARVNDSSITREEFYAILRNQSSQISQLGSSQVIAFELSVLNSIIDREIILQKAEEMGIDPEITDQDVEDYIDQILTENEMTREDLINNLEQQGFDYADLKQDIRLSLKQDELIQQVRESSYSNITVSEEEIRDSFEKVQIMAIVKGFEDNQEEAEAEIKEALSLIKEGRSFEKVAEEYSDLDQIDLGLIGRDDLYIPTSVIEKAFAMGQDEVSDLIETSDTYYIIKVLEKKLAEGEEYAEAKAEIEDSLLQGKQSKTFANWLENTRAETEREIFDPAIEGYKALREGDYQLAINQLSGALEINPLPSIYTFLANAYHGNEELDKARETFTQAIEKYPDDWELRFNYGNFLAELDETENALAEYDQASELAVEDFMAHYQLYIAYSSLEAEEKAEAEMKIIQEIQEKIQAEQEELQPEQEKQSEE